MTTTSRSSSSFAQPPAATTTTSASSSSGAATRECSWIDAPWFRATVANARRARSASEMPASGWSSATSVGSDPEADAHGLRVEPLPRHAARVEGFLRGLAELQEARVLDQLLAGLLLEGAPPAVRVLGELNPLRVRVGEPEDPRTAVARAATVVEFELLVHVDLVAVSRERGRSSEPVDAGTDDRDAHVRILAERRRRAGPQSPPFASNRALVRLLLAAALAVAVAVSVRFRRRCSRPSCRAPSGPGSWRPPWPLPSSPSPWPSSSSARRSSDGRSRTSASSRPCASAPWPSPSSSSWPCASTASWRTWSSAVVPVVVPVVPVVVPVPKLQAPSVSPCPMCAGSAFLLISIVTPGFFFDPVLCRRSPCLPSLLRSSFR